MDGLYLYGIVRVPPELDREIQGLGGYPVRVVARDDVGALVSRSPLRPWPVDEAHVTVHEAVVEEVMTCCAILPVRFNTILRSEEAIIGLLEARAQAFRSALDRVAGKVEMGLRAFWKLPAEAALLDHRTREGGPGTGYLYRRLREEQRLARLHAAGERLIREVGEFFHSLAAASWLERFPGDRQFFNFRVGVQLSTPVDNCMDTRLLFSAAYLVERGRTDAFRERVVTAQQKFSHLSFLLTGPWPPYHFVNGAKDKAKDTFSAR